MDDQLTLDDLKPQRKTPPTQLFRAEKKLAAKLDIPEIPIGKPIDTWIEDLPLDQQKEVRHKIVVKATEGISLKAKESVTNHKIRQEIITSSSNVISPMCAICSSIYYAVYLEWITIEHRSYPECSRLALLAFNEDISDHTFYNHMEYHVINKDWERRLRKLMVLKDPTADPKKVTGGMIQLLAEEIAQDSNEDGINLKTGKLLKEFIKVDVEYKKLEVKTAPMVDNSKTNFTQIINTGNIPLSTDTQKMLASGMTDDEKRRLDVLQEKWEKKGTSKIAAMIPQDVPRVDPKKNKDGKNIITIDES